MHGVLGAPKKPHFSLDSPSYIGLLTGKGRGREEQMTEQATLISSRVHLSQTVELLISLSHITVSKFVFQGSPSVFYRMHTEFLI